MKYYIFWANPRLSTDYLHRIRVYQYKNRVPHRCKWLLPKYIIKKRDNIKIDLDNPYSYFKI